MVAFGGNALLPPGGIPTDQARAAAGLSRALPMLLRPDEGAVLVHGNGPQVGMLLLRMEAARDALAEPLDMLVAETQGSLGYIMAREIRRAGSVHEVAAVITQVVVDEEDLAWDNPDKPVGPFYSDQRAEEMRLLGWDMVKQENGWRRVVPSPRPLRVVEAHTISDAVSHGHLVVAGGGGGIPVVEAADGLAGVEGVVDKDLTAALLAVDLKARLFLILTDVDSVYRSWGRPERKRLESVNVAEAQSLLAAGEFSAGSMGPKVEAAMQYVEQTGQPALITDLNHLAASMDGKGGTWVVK
ncbi:MAG: Carbamate kinase [Methanosaeta sp. PtaB.Bin039]|nr:MAG: Carbamate kinase [Methanosaeta sp. PtaB.Bin039]OPY47440.1 MAG: Carbamate kinase [Methanosaeta sp. PtaU1.Bin028]HOT07537.1 carbamate kinase [Methanotrichaceae archaeon]HQI53790.1 carbamate kinase [Methanothrix soehngenii]HQF16437.1 carbamate kinase [Methanotrichaceae archaeon]